jgi:hypothetical protein
MSIKTTKLNNIKVVPLEVPKFDITNTKGYEYFKNPYSNVFLCARKKSGKTSVIYNIIKHMINKKTKVIIFSSSYNRDPTYIKMIEDLRKNKYKVDAFDHFINDKVSLLDEIFNDDVKVEKVKNPNISIKLDSFETAGDELKYQHISKIYNKPV